MIEKSILPQNWDIPDSIRRRLGKRVGRQRPMAAEGHLVLVLHAPPKTDDNKRVGRLFWRDPDGQWKSNEQGKGIAALNRHIDEYEDLLAALDRKEEDAEDAEDYFAVLDRLAPLARSARHQHHALQEARKACPDYRDLIDLRDRAYAVERAAELLYSETKNSLDFVVAKRAEEQAQAGRQMAQASHRLNVLAAIFLPILTLTAILGVDLATFAAIFGWKTETFVSNGYAQLYCILLIVVGMCLGIILTLLVLKSPNSDRETNRTNKSPPKMR